MTLWGAGGRALRRCFVYSGRATHAEFWGWMRLVGVAVLVVFALLLLRLAIGLWSIPGFGRAFGNLLFAAVLVGVPAFLPTLAAAVRRLHDTGRRGWWAPLWCVAPIPGWMIFLGTAFRALGEGLTGGAPPPCLHSSRWVSPWWSRLRQRSGRSHG